MDNLNLYLMWFDKNIYLVVGCHRVELHSLYIEELMDRLMSYLNKLGVDFVVINGYKVISDIIRFSNNNLDIIRTHDKSFIGIDIGYKRRRLYTDIHVIEFEKAKETIDKILKTVDYIPPASIYPYIPEDRLSYSIIPNIYSEDLSIETALEMVKDLVKYGKRYKLESVAGAIKINRVKRLVYTSFGGEGEYKKSNVNLNVRLFKKQYISSVLNRETISLKDIDIDEGFIESFNLIRRVNKASKVEPGKYNVLLSPNVVANLLYHLSNGFSAYNVHIQKSPFVGKLGERVLSEDITIFDNAIEPSNPGATPFDEEGIPTSNVLIVEDGVLKTYLHNLATANLYGVKSTGHAGRINPRPHSLMLRPGSTSSFNSLAIDIKDGIYITNVWYTRFQNYFKGDFSTIQRDVALVIKDGELTEAVHGCRISDNIVRMFNDVIGFAEDPIWVKWWDTPIVAKVPYMAVKDVQITTG